MIQKYNISSIKRADDINCVLDHTDYQCNDIFNISQITTGLINSPIICTPNILNSDIFGICSIKYDTSSYTDKLIMKNIVDIGDTDLPIPSVFQTSSRHTYVSPEDVSER